MSHLIARLARASALRPWRVLALALFFSLLALLAASHLPVYTSRQALLPQDTEVAQRFNRFLEKFGAASDLMIAIENAPREDMEAFATELAIRLREEPEIAQVTERLETKFFLEHAYLHIPQDQFDSLENQLLNTKPNSSVSLDQILKALSATTDLGSLPQNMDIKSAQKGVRALNAFLSEWKRWLESIPKPQSLDWHNIASPVGAESLADGFFLSKNGKMLVVFVHARNHSSDFGVLQPFNEKVRAVTEVLKSEFKARGRTEPVVGFTGLPAIEYEEYIDIEKDIRLVIWTAGLLIAGLILLVVRSPRWALAIFIPMGLGALWSLAFAYFAIGHLTIITSSFLAILFGLGADYGIFSSSQIAEEREQDLPLVDAISKGMQNSFPALMTAGGASLLVFGALASVEFPGFSELGVVAGGGVLLILISTWVIQPAIYVLIPPKKRVSKPAPSRARNLQGKFPNWLATALILVALSTAALGFKYGGKLSFDYDVLALLPKNSKAAEYQRRMVKETDYQSEVVIFTAQNMAEAGRITDEAARLGTIAKVQSMAGLFPENAQERLARAQTISQRIIKSPFHERLNALDRSGVSPANMDSMSSLLERGLQRIDDAEEQAFSSGHSEIVKDLEVTRTRMDEILTIIRAQPDQARDRTQALLSAVLNALHQGLDTMASWAHQAPLKPSDLPASIHDRFIAKDGTIAVYAFPAESVYNPDNLDRLVHDVYSVSPEATGFPTTHQVFSKAVVSSFSKGTLMAVGLVLVWLLIVLRKPKSFILAALPLLIGGGWMLGLMAVFGLHYNYANIIALPLVIALAVDYGVWYSHRWGALEGHSPLEITLNAGKVIALAAGTEFAGLGAITLASYRGVSSLGIDISLGLITCLVSTFLIAPAIGQMLDRGRNRVDPS